LEQAGRGTERRAIDMGKGVAPKVTVAFNKKKIKNSKKTERK